LTRRRTQNNVTISYTKLAIVGLLVFFLGYAIVQRLNSQLSDVTIEITKSPDKKYLLSKKDIRDKLKLELGYDISLSNLGQLDLYYLESFLDNDDRINKSNLYIDKHNRLHIEVEQRRPIVRIQVSGARDFYLDYNGDRIPVTETFRVPVVTGHVDGYTSNYKSQKNNNLKDIWELSQRIYDNDFLRVLVEQIDMNAKGDMTIVPKFPQSKIVVGDALDLDGKLSRITDYYKGLKQVGFIKDKNEVDVQFEGQVIRRESQS
jgi:cell division protein FtsQ